MIPNCYYSVDCWIHSHLREDSPPKELLDTLPPPLPSLIYSPSWGKYSEAARKATATRNFKRYSQNVETFRREVLPVVLPYLTAEALHDIGIELRDADLLERGGKRLWVAGEKASWIAKGHEDEQRALNLGASPLTTSAALAFLASK